MAGNGAESEVHGHKRPPQADTRARRCGYPTGYPAGYPN